MNADQLAEQHGLRVEMESGPAREPYANLVVVQVVRADRTRTVAATHNGTEVRVVGLDDYQVDISPSQAPHALMVENVDRPGMIGRVGSMLGGHDVNIRYMSVAPGLADGRALMVLGVDRALADDEVSEITALDNVFSARQIELS